MTAPSSPNISSFVIRFVISNSGDASPEQPIYHGIIRHIQSDEGLNFRSWKEVEAFIRRFVPLEEEAS
jgi:hypothetical protein